MAIGALAWWWALPMQGRTAWWARPLALGVADTGVMGTVASVPRPGRDSPAWGHLAPVWCPFGRSSRATTNHGWAQAFPGFPRGGDSTGCCSSTASRLKLRGGVAWWGSRCQALGYIRSRHISVLRRIRGCLMGTERGLPSLCSWLGHRQCLTYCGSGLYSPISYRAIAEANLRLPPMHLQWWCLASEQQEVAPVSVKDWRRRRLRLEMLPQERQWTQ